MAKKIDKVKTKMGRLIRVENTKRPIFTNAKKFYTAVYVEDPSGDNERCLLFTDRELARASKRACRNKEDLLKLGFLEDLFS